MPIACTQSPNIVRDNPSSPQSCVYLHFLFTVYYKLYAEHGEIPAKHPIYPNTDQFRSLARIDVKLIPPPHTLYTLIRCISFFEDFPYDGWHQLFGDIASESPLKNENALVRRSGGPGSTPERPLAFVRSAEMAQRIRSTAHCSS